MASIATISESINHRQPPLAPRFGAVPGGSVVTTGDVMPDSASSSQHHWPITGSQKHRQSPIVLIFGGLAQIGGLPVSKKFGPIRKIGGQFLDNRYRGARRPVTIDFAREMNHDPAQTPHRRTDRLYHPPLLGATLLSEARRLHQPVHPL